MHYICKGNSCIYMTSVPKQDWTALSRHGHRTALRHSCRRHYSYLVGPSEVYEALKNGRAQPVHHIYGQFIITLLKKKIHHMSQKIKNI